jgi:PAS domain S-box-containing protein
MLFELELAEEVRPVFHYVSTGSYDLIGVPPEELRARPETFFRMIDGEDRARLYRDLVRTDRELTDLDWEGRLTLIGGREKWVRVTGRPVESAEGAVKWTAVAMDVTESRQSSGSLAEADARLSAILNSLGDAVVTVDEEGTVRSVNTAYERLSGVPAHEAVGRTLDGTLEIASSGAGTRRLQVLTRPDGSRATVEVTTVVHNLGGRQFVTGIVRERPEPIVAEARAVVTLAEEAPRASRGVVIASEQDVETYRLPGVVLDEAHVVAATTVGMGLELAKRLAPDVLALVSGLPDVDLASVVEAVRSEDSLQGVWIIVTGVPESAFPRLHRAGADECVVEKGDTPRVLSQALAKVGHTGI